MRFSAEYHGAYQWEARVVYFDIDADKNTPDGRDRIWAAARAAMLEKTGLNRVDIWKPVLGQLTT